ncbi:MAG: TlpA family protein disulfide reductase [Alistipes sp.]|nr:TlpA family protein disulfide reductase [Alistipes sp.]
MRIRYTLGALLLLASCTEQPAKPVQCHIMGTVIDRPESKVLELYTHIDGEAAMSSRPVAEIKIRDGKFAYDLALDEADYCTLSFAEEKARGSWFPIHFIADGDTVRLTLYPNAEEHRIEGTGATAEFQGYKEQLALLNEAYYEKVDSLDECNAYNSEAYTALMAQLETTDQRSDAFKALVEQFNAMPDEEKLTETAFNQRKEYEAEYLASLLAILDQKPTLARYALLAEQMQYRLPDGAILEIYERRYADALTDHYLSAYCRRQLAGLRVAAGKQYIDFEAPDVEGTMHRLSTLMEGAELTLLDLWASWCAPCRRGSMAVLPLYEQYKERGFKVIGVARESEDLSDLKRAIKQDGYPWPQLVELDDRIHLWAQYGCSNAAGRKLLINKEGVIIAIDPSTEELTAILHEQFGQE